MIGRFSIYTARDPDTGGPGYAGFVETSKFLHCCGFRLRADEVRADLESAMRRHGIDRARSDEGEVIDL